MAKRFEFRERSLPLELDIAGHPFVLMLNKGVSEKLQAFSSKAQEISETMQDTEESAEKAWAFLAAALDDLLGAGATDTVFEGRAPNAFDMVDIISYICEQIEGAAKQQTVTTVSMPAKQQSVEQALHVMQNPEVMAAVAKAMQ